MDALMMYFTVLGAFVPVWWMSGKCDFGSRNIILSALLFEEKRFSDIVFSIVMWVGHLSWIIVPVMLFVRAE